MSVPFGSDPWLDARLRNVPLPPGMLARLQQLAQEGAADLREVDAGEVDARGADTSRSVPQPGPKLYSPNRPVPLGPALTDEQLDAALVDVTVPAGLRQRLERIAQERRPRFRGRHLALAASLLVALGAGYLSRSMFFQAGPVEPPVPLATNNRSSQALEERMTLPEQELTASSNPDTFSDVELLIDSDLVGNELLEQGPHAHELIEDLRLRLMQQAAGSRLAEELPVAPDAVAVMRPDKESVFASDRTFDALPELEVVRGETEPRGLAPPINAGYDLRFQARTGHRPFVVPARHAALQAVNVPLITSSASYQRAWEALAERKLPLADDVRVEDFLAGIQYGFAPAVPGSVALRTAAGPSPLAEHPGMRLLQVGVQAGRLVDQPRAGTALTIVVDTSASMRRGGRLAKVRQALAEIATRLGPADRYSLLACGDESRMMIEAAGPDKLGKILAAIESLEPQQSTNVGAGLEAALASATRSFPPELASAGVQRRVVLVTDGLGHVSSVARQRMVQLATDAAGQGIHLSVLNVGSPRVEQDNALLNEIAAAGGGKSISAVDAGPVRLALLEVLEGRNQVVARLASLQITFNPRVVAAYRLLGHETETLTGSATAPQSLDLYAEDAATALFELRLNAQGGDEVATLELAWTDTSSGERRSATQRVSRMQFAKTFTEAPLSLQMAAIAGTTAEVLRGSPFVGSARTLDPVLELAAQASPLALEEPSMKILLSFIQQAEKVRSPGSSRP